MYGITMKIINITNGYNNSYRNVKNRKKLATVYSLKVYDITNRYNNYLI